jgi:hypothetical protein
MRWQRSLPQQFRSLADETCITRRNKCERERSDDGSRVAPTLGQVSLLHAPFAGGVTVVGQANPQTLNMQQLPETGIGPPASATKSLFRVELAKHSAEA